MRDKQGELRDVIRRNIARMVEVDERSARRICQDAKLGKTFISDVFAEDAGLPSLSALVKLADGLGCEITELVGPRNQQHVERQLTELMDGIRALNSKARGYAAPDVGEILAMRSSGTLDDFQNVMDLIEVFDAPNESDPWPCPTHMGSGSLAARELGLRSPGELSTLLTLSQDGLPEQIALSHKRCLESDSPSISQQRAIIRPANGLAIDITYLRLHFRVSDPERGFRLVHYSKPITLRGVFGEARPGHSWAGPPAHIRAGCLKRPHPSLTHLDRFW